jgi:hypothetical protein
VSVAVDTVLVGAERDMGLFGSLLVLAQVAEPTRTIRPGDADYGVVFLPRPLDQDLDLDTSADTVGSWALVDA